MGERHERLAKNEVVFREVNERIQEVTSGSTEVEFLCECSNASCAEPLAMTVAEYEMIRSEPERFVVANGHEAPEIETVLERRDRFTVVEKRPGPPADIAVDNDPRS